MKRILFVHNNFPAQFRVVARQAQALGYQCAAISSQTGQSLAGVPLQTWRSARGSTPGLLTEATRAEADLIRASAAAVAASRLQLDGFEPDLIIGHPGWGETIYLRELFPRAKQILYAEYFYRTRDGDVGFDLEFGPGYAEVPVTLHAKNMGLALALLDADVIVAPTAFQASRLPVALADRTRVIHEGIDIQRFVPDPSARLMLPDGSWLDGSMEVVTYASRRLEPLRGFHTFMRALPGFLGSRPRAQVVVIGANERGGYGANPEAGLTWGEMMMKEVGGRLPKDRVHFLGRVSHDTLIKAYQISSAHVYYTYPFVLSWSMLEAMACECLVLASDTSPVRDVIAHQRNGILLDFFDPGALSFAMSEACERKTDTARIRKAARTTMLERFDQAALCTPAWLRLIDELIGPP